MSICSPQYGALLRRSRPLTAERERMLARRWHEHEDRQALDELVVSHLPLVLKIARRYRGYGPSGDDLVAQGNIGLLKAATRFDPERGVRFAAYAATWIRAEMQEYVFRSWSMVRLANTRVVRKLFFKLRQLKRALRPDGRPAEMTSEDVSAIATLLGVPEGAVLDMDRRLAFQDVSLNAHEGPDEGIQKQDQLVDSNDDQERALIDRRELAHRRVLLARALGTLSERERNVLIERRLNEEVSTVGRLALRYGISPERISQIDAKAFQKVRKAVLQADRDAREAA